MIRVLVMIAVDRLLRVGGHALDRRRHRRTRGPRPRRLDAGATGAGAGRPLDWATTRDRHGRDDGGPQATRDLAWTGGDTLEVDVPADVDYTQAAGPGEADHRRPAARWSTALVHRRTATSASATATTAAMAAS